MEEQLKGIMEEETYKRLMRILREENDKLVSRVEKELGVKCECGQMVSYSDCEIIDNDNLALCKDCYKKNKDEHTFKVLRSLEDRIDYSDLDE